MIDDETMKKWETKAIEGLDKIAESSIIKIKNRLDIAICNWLERQVKLIKQSESASEKSDLIMQMAAKTDMLRNFLNSDEDVTIIRGEHFLV